MARTHTFKGSTNGWGYSAFIENNELVLFYSDPHEGGAYYRGTYEQAGKALASLQKEAPRLYNNITKYYEEQAAAAKAGPGPYTFPHTFNDSRDTFGNGWYGYIEDGQLFIGHEAPHEGGVLFSGTYEEAAERGWLATLLREDQRLYHDIDKYFIKHGAEPKVSIKEKISSPAGVLWKVKLYMSNTEAPIIYVQVRGNSEASVINKLFPKIPEVLTLQTHDARVIAIRSDMISAAEFMPED